MKGLVGGRGVEECYMHVSKSLITDFGVQSNLLRRPSLKVELLQPNLTGLSGTKLSLNADSCKALAGRSSTV